MTDTTSRAPQAPIEVNEDALRRKGIKLTKPTRKGRKTHMNLIEFHLYWNGEDYALEWNFVEDGANVVGAPAAPEAYAGPFASVVANDEDGEPSEYLLEVSGGSPLYATKA